MLQGLLSGSSGGSAPQHILHERAFAEARERLRRGESVVLYSEEGVGKSTLLTLLARTLADDGRTVTRLRQGDATTQTNPRPSRGLLIADDLHAVSPAGLARVERAASTGEGAVLASIDAHVTAPAASNLVMGLWRSGRLHRLDLSRLTLAQSLRLTETVAASPEQGRVDAVAMHRQSGGLPVLVAELAGTGYRFLPDGDANAPEFSTRVLDLAAYLMRRLTHAQSESLVTLGLLGPLSPEDAARIVPEPTLVTLTQRGLVEHRSAPRPSVEVRRLTTDALLRVIDPTRAGDLVAEARVILDERPRERHAPAATPATAVPPRTPTALALVENLDWDAAAAQAARIASDTSAPMAERWRGLSILAFTAGLRGDAATLDEVEGHRVALHELVDEAGEAGDPGGQLRGVILRETLRQVLLRLSLDQNVVGDTPRVDALTLETLESKDARALPLVHACLGVLAVRRGDTLTAERELRQATCALPDDACGEWVASLHVRALCLAGEVEQAETRLNERTRGRDHPWHRCLMAQDAAVIAQTRGLTARAQEIAQRAEAEFGPTYAHTSGPTARTPRTPLDSTAEALTRRERQVAALAAQGLSNKDIADRLYLSVRTVESHVYQAQRKLGVHKRHDLARHAEHLVDA